MNGWLIDTNVLSELIRPRPEARVVTFFDRTDDLYLSVITLHEIAYGATRAPDPVRRAKLSAWLAQIAARFGEGILPVDRIIAERAGALRAGADSRGRPADPLDALIAATAIHHGLRLVTRDINDFRDFGPELYDPWSD